MHQQSHETSLSKFVNADAECKQLLMRALGTSASATTHQNESHMSLLQIMTPCQKPHERLAGMTEYASYLELFADRQGELKQGGKSIFHIGHLP